MASEIATCVSVIAGKNDLSGTVGMSPNNFLLDLPKFDHCVYSEANSAACQWIVHPILQLRAFNVFAHVGSEKHEWILERSAMSREYKTPLGGRDLGGCGFCVMVLQKLLSSLLWDAVRSRGQGARL
jgi:hypothetical protein